MLHKYFQLFNSLAMTCYVFLGQVVPKLNIEILAITNPVEGKVYNSVLHIIYF